MKKQQELRILGVQWGEIYGYKLDKNSKLIAMSTIMLKLATIHDISWSIHKLGTGNSWEPDSEPESSGSKWALWICCSGIWRSKRLRCEDWDLEESLRVGWWQHGWDKRHTGYISSDNNDTNGIYPMIIMMLISNDIANRTWLAIYIYTVSNDNNTHIQWYSQLNMAGCI